MIPRIFIRKNDKTGQNSRKTEKSIFLIFSKKVDFSLGSIFRVFLNLLKKGHFWVIFGIFLSPQASGNPRDLVKIRGGSYFSFWPFFGFQYETHEWEHPGYPPGGHFRGPIFGGFWVIFPRKTG